MAPAASAFPPLPAVVASPPAVPPPPPATITRDCCTLPKFGQRVSVRRHTRNTDAPPPSPPGSTAFPPLLPPTSTSIQYGRPGVTRTVPLTSPPKPPEISVPSARVP